MIIKKGDGTKITLPDSIMITYTREEFRSMIVALQLCSARSSQDFYYMVENFAIEHIPEETVNRIKTDSILAAIDRMLREVSEADFMNDNPPVELFNELLN